MSFLVTGLGNIGTEYAGTRHNIGFSVLDAWAALHKTSFSTLRYGSLACIKHAGKQVWLLKPSTYVNLSGKAVRYWMKEESVPMENLMIVLDDVALPFGKLRMRAKGSDGGHNGLKNISLLLETEGYARLRIGVGGDFSRGYQADYVLSHWNEQEARELPFICNNAIQALELYIRQGIDRAMNLVNTTDSGN
ncbi:MAG TPA: aminoacyl-tRNA hydrolase [Bacteroidales bacterium]|jgi:PTH1 family peptidyl-tRNA hydrolase|nr:aminoacyl-tRNA hydrolase [Bacteroidales bacterium]MCZ2417550.1 aminoacyl-tRNA hydrolase [Burkholderiales bacterium]OQC57531.1 MAG: Peptidyl-tRNA hydrolase [Bacteroidetes bacterium ADurb.Bin013]MBP8999710.1 aminoacyl-tRNA hydrolase [Bacteroidales bacterium]MBV6456125.1 Peptidyl-tRNA hydrolase [Bacteroidales bacterium]